MANEIDLVVGQVAFDKITELINRLKDVDTEFGKIATKFSDLGKTSNPQSTAELAKLTAENEKLNKALTELRASYTTIDTELAKANTTRASSSKLITQETIDIRLQNKELAQTYTELSKNADSYQKADAQFKQMAKSLKNMAFEGKEGTKDFIKLENELTKLGNKLKSVDAMTGSHTRNVGNYASSWNGLGNSINQLTREAPAFANSVQTGFMALSNNIPILTDELGVLIDKNKKLQEQGKPTESILKTVAGAFFSWQTAISLGVTILTVYGAKLWDMVSGLDELKKKQEAFTISQKLMDDQITQTTTNILHQGKMRKDAAILAGASADDIREIDLQTQKDVQANLVLVNESNKKKYENSKHYSDLENEREEINRKIAVAGGLFKFRLSEEQAKLKAKLEKNTAELDKYRNWKETEEGLKSKKDAYDKSNKALVKQGFIVSELQSSQKVEEYNQAKAAQDKIDKLANKPVKQEKRVLKFDEVKSEKDLQQAKIEGQKIDLESADLDKMTTDEKIINRNKLTQIQLDAIKSVQEEEIAVADKKRKDDLTENDRAKNNGTISREQYNKNIEDIDKTHKTVLEKIDVEASNKTRQLKSSDLKYNQDLLDKDTANKQKHTINQFEAEKLVQKKLSEDSKKNSDSSTKERIAAFDKFKEISQKELEFQRDNALAKTKNKEEQQLINDEYDKGVKLLGDMASPLDAIKDKTKDWLNGFGQTGLDSPLKAFGMESAKMFLDFDENNESTFSKMYDNAEKGKEKFAVAFGAISEAGQGAFNAIAKASMEQYDAEYERLESQKQAALKSVGDNAVAKEKIEAEFAKKKKAIDKKKFEAEKKISMVNIVMDTAQAVVATLAKGGGFFATPLAMIVAALGAVQLGVVASKQFPAYAEGTDNHSGGLMLVNDGAGNNFQEKIILPNGKVIRPQGRNVLMDAPKGTKVLNHEQQLFEMLQSNNISMSSPQYQGMTPDEMDEILGKHFGNIKTQNTIFDKNGFQSYVKNGNSITRSNSNRSQAIGISV